MAAALAAKGYLTTEYHGLALRVTDSPRLGSTKSPHLGRVDVPHTPSTPQLAWRSPRKQSRNLGWLAVLGVAAIVGLLLVYGLLGLRRPTARQRLHHAFRPLNGAVDPLVLPSLFTKGHSFTPVTPSRVLIMQSDTRPFANVSFEKPQEADYWVSSVMANLLWAVRHGYDYQRPVVADWPGWHSTWPRMKAIRDVIAANKHDYIVFFDSDAFVVQPELSLDDLRRRWGMHDQASFLASHDRWPDKIIAGFWIFRNSATTLKMLDDMLSCPELIPSCAIYKTQAYHEQEVFNQFLKPRYAEGEELIVAPCVEAYGAPNYSTVDDCQGTIIRHTGGPGKGQLPGQVAETMLRTLWDLLAVGFNGTHLTLR